MPFFNLPIDILLLFTITTPAIGWLLSKAGREGLSGVYALVGLALSGVALYQTYAGLTSSGPAQTQATGLFSAVLSTDMLSIFMTTIFIGLGVAITIYSLRYMEREGGKFLYYAMILAMVSGMTGVVFAGDLFTLFVFWELMSISSYVLVSFHREKWEPVEAGFKFLIMGVAGSATALFGMSLLYGMAGTLNFGGLANAFSQTASGPWLWVALLFIIAGFGVKAAIVPLHTWLPDAYSAASAPISAILAGVVTEVGIYALARTFFSAFLSIQAQWVPILAVLSVLTMVVGNVSAILQDDLKRLLAYSSIGQIGYMLTGLAVGTQLGLTGTFLQLFNHALMKGTAFLCAGAIAYRLGTGDLKSMDGVGRKMPVTTVILSISMFALIGMPPLNGFISELTLFTASAQANMAWLGISIILNSAISAVYSLRVIRALMQSGNGNGNGAMEKVKEAPLLMLVPICIMGALIVLFGVWPDPLIRFAQQAAAALLHFAG